MRYENVSFVFFYSMFKFSLGPTEPNTFPIVYDIEKKANAKNLKPIVMIELYCIRWYEDSSLPYPNIYGNFTNEAG